MSHVGADSVSRGCAIAPSQLRAMLLEPSMPLTAKLVANRGFIFRRLTTAWSANVGHVNVAHRLQCVLLRLFTAGIDGHAAIVLSRQWVGCT